MGSSAEDRLADQAHDFATLLTRLLNGTVTRGARVTSAVVPGSSGRAYAFVAPGAIEEAPKLPRRPVVPLSTARRKEVRERTPLWLWVHFVMELDQEREWAAVQKSKFGLYVDREALRPLVRIEYDRTSQSRHPAAHVQVHGQSAELGYALGALGAAPRPLEKLHVPVGGRRFRPSLEDFIQFLQTEGLARNPHPQWRRVLDESRRGFHERQLRAAVRRDQKVAAAALRDLGWTVSAPQTPAQA